MEAYQMKDKIISLIAEKPKHYTKIIQNNKEMLDWVNLNCDPNCIKISTKIYTAINNETILCPCGSGKHRFFESINKPLGFCGKAGSCSACNKSVSTNVKVAAKLWDKEAAKKARALTCEAINGLGITNNGQTPKAIANHKAFYKDAAKVKEVTDRVSQTYFDRTGYWNPRQNPICYDKTQATVLNKWGVNNINQIHVGGENLDILLDADKLRIVIDEIENINDICSFFNITKQTLMKYHDMHDLNIISISKSLFEDQIEEFLIFHNIKYYKNNRKILGGKEIDFLLTDYNIAIECNGLYWHSESFKTKDYHKIKYDMIKSNNLKTLMIWHDEWLLQKDIVKNRILYLCKKINLTIGARKISIQKIKHSQEVIDFLNRNHIQGNVAGNDIVLGGFYQDKLVSVMTLKKENIYHYDINRYCTDMNASYPGLFSKFLSVIKNMKIKSVSSIADLRWSDGNLYKTSGFVIQKKLQADYQYTNYKHRYHKFNFRKSRIKKKFNIDITGKTEWELMKFLGYDRIWDCGKIKFHKNL